MSIIATVVIVLIALFVGLQVFMVLKMKAKKGSAVPPLEGIVGQRLRGNGKVLFYFYSQGCRACKPMTPFMHELAGKNKQVMMVDVARDMNTAQKFGVMGTPSLVLVEGGKIVEFLVGFQSENKVRSLLA